MSKSQMINKKFKLTEEQIVTLVEAMGACMATDMITVEGLTVGYMYREEPDFDNDSGWRFFSGTENQDYVDNPENTMIYDVNTIANYDRSIIPYLHEAVGDEFEREGSGFKKL